MEEDEEEEISGDVVWKMLIIQQVLNYNAVSAVFGMYLAAIKAIEDLRWKKRTPRNLLPETRCRHPLASFSTDECRLDRHGRT